MKQFFSNQDQDTKEFQILNMNNLAICYILSDKKIFFLYFQKYGNLKYQKPWRKFGKYTCWGRKHGETLCDSLGKPGPGPDPEPHCSWSISLHPSRRCRISEQFVNLGKCHCPSKLVHWVTQDVFSWHFDPRYQMFLALSSSWTKWSFGNTFAQPWAKK